MNSISIPYTPINDVNYGQRIVVDKNNKSKKINIKNNKIIIKGVRKINLQK